MLASKTLGKSIVTPNKVAAALNWRKLSAAVLNLEIRKDQIGLLLGSHPAVDQDAQKLEPIQFQSRERLPEDAVRRIEDLVQEHNVCGFVVSWPLQKDTGSIGAACGWTIRTVEDLLADSQVISPSRPLCLWDSEHPVPSRTDRWGRCAEYTRTSDKEVHVASEEQYNHNLAVEKVWDDFKRIHWPAAV